MTARRPRLSADRWAAAEGTWSAGGCGKRVGGGLFRGAQKGEGACHLPSWQAPSGVGTLRNRARPHPGTLEPVTPAGSSCRPVPQGCLVSRSVFLPRPGSGFVRSAKKGIIRRTKRSRLRRNPRKILWKPGLGASRRAGSAAGRKGVLALTPSFRVCSWVQVPNLSRGA